MEKREAEKLVKHVIKSAVKLGVLRRHGQLSAADERALAAFRSKFHVSVHTIMAPFDLSNGRGSRRAIILPLKPHSFDFWKQTTSSVNKVKAPPNLKIYC